MIHDLKEKISTLKLIISDLEREKRVLTDDIKSKKERLVELELLTVNQMDLFKDGEKN